MDLGYRFQDNRQECKCVRVAARTEHRLAAQYLASHISIANTDRIFC
ncbi:MAG: hypothetical protein F6K55_06985 [Moorea sp. SIO4A3]|nr:hypothetical protein [Moorena sp. SIO4A3]